MKLHYYSHASFQIITDSGFRLLSDPWVYNPVSNTLWQFPECRIRKPEYTDQDALYISHSHSDHFCPDTLRHFRRDIPIVIRQYGDHDNPLRPILRQLGFTQLIELEHLQTRELAPGLVVTLYADLDTYDSSLVIEADGATVFHQNDCMLDPEDASMIGERHNLDVALLGLVNSSIYPTFFDMDPARKAVETDRRRIKVLARTADFARRLNARYVIPNASDMVYVRFPETDCMLGPHATDMAAYFREHGLFSQVVTMSPGDVFDVANPHTDYQPAYASHEQLLEQLAELRARPHVQAMIDKLERWESEFVFDSRAFVRRLQDYAQWATANWAALFAERFAEVEQPRYVVELHLADTGLADLDLRIDVDYQAGRFQVSQLSAPGTDFDMRLSGRHRYFEMFRRGVFAFDDIRAGWLLIQRPGDFNKAEVGFWHLMMCYSNFILQHPDGEDRLLPRPFSERVAKCLEE